MMRILQKLRRRMNGEGGLHDRRGDDLDHDLGRRRVHGRPGDDLRPGHAPVCRARSRPRAPRSISRWKRPARSTTTTSCCRTPRQLSHSSDTTNPDYWVDANAQTYDPDGSGAWPPSRSCASQARRRRSQHYQNPLLDGATTYEVYRYVTWVDSPQDGTGAADAADGNQDGISDANGQDAKRVTVVVVWNDELGRGNTSLSESSLFSDGQIVYTAPTTNRAPTVSCPTASVSDKTVTFTANASDTDGTIASVSWNFGDSATATGARRSTRTRGYATYTVVNTVTDNGGSTASNSRSRLHGDDGQPRRAATAVRTARSSSTRMPPTRTRRPSRCRSRRLVAGRTLQRCMLSNDNSTWLGPFGVRDLVHMDHDAAGLAPRPFMRASSIRAATIGAIANDTITLDTVAPGTPTSFAKASTTTPGANTTIHLHLGGARRRHRPGRVSRVSSD